MNSPDFNALLLRISNELPAEQLESLKFLCPDIGRRDRERCTTGLKLFQILMQRGQLGPDNTERLQRHLTELQRPDLCELLREGAGAAPQRAAGAEKLDTAAEVLSETLGRNWRKLGRKLGLSEVKLDSIAKKQPTDLEETAMELVRQWTKSKDEQATVQELIQALRDCQLNLTADTVEDRLATL